VLAHPALYNRFKLMQGGENWLARSLWGLRGTPRYLKGKLPSEKQES